MVIKAVVWLLGQTKVKDGILKYKALGWVDGWMDREWRRGVGHTFGFLKKRN